MTDSQFSTAPPRVVLCDDQIHLLRATEYQFVRSGYDVRLALDGLAAWEILQQERPDLLICDYQMPKLTGLELLQRIRRDVTLQDLPILMITAKCFEISRDELCRRYNLSCILQKPFRPRDLLRRVEEELVGVLPN